MRLLPLGLSAVRPSERKGAALVSPTGCRRCGMHMASRNPYGARIGSSRETPAATSHMALRPWDGHRLHKLTSVLLHGQSPRQFQLESPCLFDLVVLVWPLGPGTTTRLLASCSHIALGARLMVSLAMGRRGIRSCFAKLLIWLPFAIVSANQIPLTIWPP